MTPANIVSEASKPLDHNHPFAQRRNIRSFIMRIMGLIFAVSLSTATVLATSGATEANAPRGRAENRTSPFDAQVKGCDDPVVLTDIKDRFDSREKTDWNSNLELVTIDHIRSGAFRPNGQDLIPRLFCTARASLSNGKTYGLSYNISEDGGFSGWHGSLFLGAWKFPTPASYHLEWCIAGLDRHHTYSPGCLMARP
jgi:hypothetical protein